MSWEIDNAHFQMQFMVRHMTTITNVHGWFERVSGTVEFDEKDPIHSWVDVRVQAASLNTKEPRRDEYLRSPDFLNAVQYPYLVYKSRRVVRMDATHGRVIGDLTIQAISREVMLDVKYTGRTKSPLGAVSAGFNARGKINRKLWGLNWNQALETGVLVGDEVAIDVDLEIVKYAELAQLQAVAA